MPPHRRHPRSRPEIGNVDEETMKLGMARVVIENAAAELGALWSIDAKRARDLIRMSARLLDQHGQ